MSPAATIAMAAVLAALVLGGCAGLQFRLDVVRAESALAETTVLTEGSGGGDVALIEVSGVITHARTPGLFGSGDSSVARLGEALARAKKERDVRAVIIRIDSRGGTVVASETVYREVRRFSEETGKPVIALMGDVAASGGYYLACGADEIVAMPSSVTGSIGVVMPLFNVVEGLERIGVRTDAIVSGPNKSIAWPFAPPAPEHREILQGIVDDLAGRFRDVVRERRPAIAEADFAEITDGRVVTGVRAHAIGLVDHVGDVHDAFRLARERAGMEGGRLVRYHAGGRRVSGPHAGDPVPPAELNLIKIDPAVVEPGFYYVWDPGLLR